MTACAFIISAGAGIGGGGAGIIGGMPGTPGGAPGGAPAPLAPGGVVPGGEPGPPPGGIPGMPAGAPIRAACACLMVDSACASDSSEPSQVVASSRGRFLATAFGFLA